LTKKEDSMSARESCQSLKEVMEAVEAMHAKGLIHADIKPDNILLMTDQNGVKRTKLIDITPLAMRDFFQTKSVTAHYYFTKEMIRKAESDLINSGMRDPRKRSEVLSRGHDTYSLAIVVGEVLLPKLKSIEGPKTPQKVAELEAHVKKITEDAVFAGDPRALARMKMLVGKLMTTLE